MTSASTFSFKVVAWMAMATFFTAQLVYAANDVAFTLYSGKGCSPQFHQLIPVSSKEEGVCRNVGPHDDFAAIQSAGFTFTSPGSGPIVVTLFGLEGCKGHSEYATEGLCYTTGYEIKSWKIQQI